jgi:endonuclease VIII
MPEGDTIFRAASTLHRALSGRFVTRFDTVLAHLARVDADTPIAGRCVERVEAAGKHLLMRFSGDLVLRTHMRMNGAWHIYREGERWRLPRSDMRIVIATAEWVAVAFRVHVAEFIRANDLARHRPLVTLGPDLLKDDFNDEAALQRIRALPDRPIADVLLDQRALAGVGNIYKSESLFLAHLHPDTLASALTDDELRNLIAVARRVLIENARPERARRAGGIVEHRQVRRTTGRMRDADRYWVYSRGGRACRKCGTRITSHKRGDDARVTYWCPVCQPMR